MAIKTEAKAATNTDVSKGIVDQINEVGINNLSRDALDEARRGASSKTNIVEDKLSSEALLALKPHIAQEFSAFMVQNIAMISQLDKLAQEAAKNPSVEGGGAAALVAEIERLGKIFDPSNSAQPDMKTLEADMNRALGIMKHFKEAFSS